MVEILLDYFPETELIDVKKCLISQKDFIIKMYETDIYNLSDMYIDKEVFDIIKHYSHSVITTKKHFDIVNYTYKYIDIIIDANVKGSISDNNLLLINGFISTLLNSKLLWNLTIADPYTSQLYIIYRGEQYKKEQGWYIITSDKELIRNAEIGYDFIGFPVLKNGKLEKVCIDIDYIYNEEKVESNKIIYELAYKGYFNNTVQNLYYNDKYIELKIGTYPIAKIEGYGDGYFYIDFK